MSDASGRPPHPIEPEKFLQMVPSSAASPKTSTMISRRYTVTVQRKERSGRWNQVATWSVLTSEEDMIGPLAMGLKPNYRILVIEGKPPPGETETENDK